MKIKPAIRVAAMFLLLSTLNSRFSTLFAQGSLTPPGAPAPVMKSLNQIEPHTPISSLPLAITNPGSYYLTTNLSETSGADGISISANDVTIDLKGFTLSGFTGAGGGSGIFVAGAHTNIVVRNGALTHWGYRGLDAAASYNGQFFQLRVSGNEDDGLDAGSGSTVIQCTVAGNVWRGIYAADASVVRDCTATDNGSAGINVNAGSVVFDCTSVGNSGDGIDASTGGTISRCSARLNNGDGFSVYQGAIVDCTAQANSLRGFYANDGSTVSRCTARVNAQDGILVGTGCRVSDNICQLNGYDGAGAGIRISGSENRIVENHVVSNDYGIQVQGTNNVIIQNSAQQNGTNYFFYLPQVIGPIGNSTDSYGFITNDNPWINFSN